MSGRALLLAATLTARISAAPITDPVHDYLESFEVRRGETVITAHPDLNGDGTPDLLITRNTLRNGRQGNLWVCYESIGPGQFRRIDQLPDGNPIEFHQKAVSLRPRRDGAGLALIRYSPGGGGEGLLSEIRLNPDGLVESDARAFRPGASAGQYEALFENPKSQLVFQEEASDLLLSRHFPLGRWFFHMTPLKWAIALVGALAGLVLVLALVRLLQATRERRSTVPR